MAELLIFAGNNTHVDPIKDRVGCWKRGMIVCVKDDGANWGSEEVIPPALGGKFVRVRLIGLEKERVLKYLEDEEVGGEIYRKKKFRVLVDNLPVGVKDALRDNGFYETSWLSVRDYVENITEGTVESGVVL